MNDWTALLGLFTTVFTAPGYAVFIDLLVGWVLTPGRHTITAMITLADPDSRRAHDAYHRFFRDGVWKMPRLWEVLTKHLVSRFAPTGTVTLDVDDTLFHKTGSEIEGAGSFRDAIRSTGNKVVYALGLNVVVVTLRVNPPWGGTPIALPVNARLKPKKKKEEEEKEPTKPGHAKAMLEEISAWLPGREFHVCGDGAYASLCGQVLPNMKATSRMRCDAALYELPPPPTGKRGRPRSKGEALHKPPKLAKEADQGQWQKVVINQRGRQVEKLVLCRDVLWYNVDKKNLLRLVTVRDPEGHQPDDFFVTNDLTATGAETASRYAGRWSIEVCFRDVKQHLGGEDPQSWKRQGPERVALLSLWIHSLVWCWYLQTHPKDHTWIKRAWYPSKKTPSFLDALAALRRIHWNDRIFSCDGLTWEHAKKVGVLVDALAYAS